MCVHSGVQPARQLYNSQQQWLDLHRCSLNLVWKQMHSLCGSVGAFSSPEKGQFVYGLVPYTWIMTYSEKGQFVYGQVPYTWIMTYSEKGQFVYGQVPYTYMNHDLFRERSVCRWSSALYMNHDLFRERSVCRWSSALYMNHDLFRERSVYPHLQKKSISASSSKRANFIAFYGSMVMWPWGMYTQLLQHVLDCVGRKWIQNLRFCLTTRPSKAYT